MNHTQLGAYVVSFFDLESLAPRHLGPADLRAWLTAPIAGEPLYRRLLEPLIGVDVAHVRFTTGRVGRALAAVLEERPVFGLRESFATRVGPGTGKLFLPGNGLVGLDVAELIARAEANARPYFVTAKPASCLSTGRSVFVWPANGSRGGSSAAPAKLSVPFGFRPTGSVRALLASSRSALLRRLPGLEPAGVWRGGMLLGARANVGATVGESAQVAVGAESRVEANVLLAEGAIVGEGCLVREGARVEDSILLNGARVRSGELLCGAVRSPSGLTLYR